MDKYFEQDKALVVAELKSIKDKLLAVCADGATKEQVTAAVSECIHDVCVLGFKLKHLDGMENVQASASNEPGLAVVKQNIKSFCSDIDQSIEDTSWIEDTETFAESQRKTVDDMIKAIVESGVQGAAKADAEQRLQMMQACTPPEGAADWVVRDMRNQILLMGIKSQLNSALVSTAEL